MKIIREAVGDEVVLDKDGSPMLNTVGIVDTGRISQDTGHSFDASRDAASGIAARYFMNRNYFIADPDAFTVSTQALRYARSRNTSSDFDRGARQQRILLSMRQQADPQTLIPRLPELVDALKLAVKTDIPLDQLPNLLGLATEVDTKDIRSYVFSPPFYQEDVPTGYWTLPYPDRIRAAVRDAFTVDPELAARREVLSGEGATIWVLNGTNAINRGSRLAGYLENEGLQASAPRVQTAGAVPADTTIVVYNGAQTGLTATIAYLESRFAVKVTTAADPAIRADVIITIGWNTPDLGPPPSS